MTDLFDSVASRFPFSPKHSPFLCQVDAGKFFKNSRPGAVNTHVIAQSVAFEIECDQDILGKKKEAGFNS